MNDENKAKNDRNDEAGSNAPNPDSNHTDHSLTKIRKTIIRSVAGATVFLGVLTGVFVNLDKILDVYHKLTVPRFILETPFISAEQTFIIIRAGNYAAKKKKNLTVRYDGSEFFEAGVIIEEGDDIRWKFDVGAYEHIGLLEEKEHKVQFCLILGRWSDTKIIKFSKGVPKLKGGKRDTRVSAVRSTKIIGEGEKAEPKSAFLPGRILNQGDVRILTILVEFEDLEFGFEKSEVVSLFNDSQYNKYGNFCSVKEYFLTMSNGKLRITSDVVGPVKLNGKRRSYSDHPFFEEALSLAIEKFSIDLKNYDSKKENIVDLVQFLYAGETLYEGWLWPHSHTTKFEQGNVKTQYYAVGSVGRRKEDLKIGTHCHTIAQALCRFPDLYDHGRRSGDNNPSAGIGYYCLMSAGSHLNRGRTPSPISAYLRDLAGWPNKEILLNIPGAYEITHGDYNVIYKYKTQNSNEYFIVENRSRIGMDQHLPSGGFAVFHCDNYGSNEWQDGTSGKHYQLALLQADGLRELEQNKNHGNEGDLWKNQSGIFLSDDTIPSSKLWDGKRSGLTLKNVSKEGKIITFQAD